MFWAGAPDNVNVRLDQPDELAAHGLVTRLTFLTTLRATDTRLPTGRDPANSQTPLFPADGLIDCDAPIYSIGHCIYYVLG